MMADNTAIEWADSTWNPVTGCMVVSPGCTNCYAMRLAGGRLRQHPTRAGLTRESNAGPVWNGEVRLNERAFRDDFLFSRRPRRVFVCAHGDLFYDAVPDEWIDRVFARMALAPQHTFLVLTKRPKRMREYITKPTHPGRIIDAGILYIAPTPGALRDATLKWPLRNVWLGVSVEDQTRADERIPELLATPAAKRFISAEPLLGPIDLTRICILPRQPGSPCAGIHVDALRGRYVESGVTYTGDWDIAGPAPPDSERRRLDWVIAGGESGPGARPPHPDWFRSLRDQCAAAGVPFFFKQWGEFTPNYALRDMLVADGEVHFTPRGIWAAGHGGHRGATALSKVGKKAAGALLDGSEYREFPI